MEFQGNYLPDLQGYSICLYVFNYLNNNDNGVGYIRGHSKYILEGLRGGLYMHFPYTRSGGTSLANQNSRKLGLFDGK